MQTGQSRFTIQYYNQGFQKKPQFEAEIQLEVQGMDSFGLE